MMLKIYIYIYISNILCVKTKSHLLPTWHDTQHEKSMTLIRQENNDLSTNLK